MLGIGHRHAISGYDEHTVGVTEHLRSTCGQALPRACFSQMRASGKEPSINTTQEQDSGNAFTAVPRQLHGFTMTLCLTSGSIVLTVDIDLLVALFRLRVARFDLPSDGGDAISSEDDVGEGAVHGLAPGGRGRAQSVGEARCRVCKHCVGGSCENPHN